MQPVGISRARLRVNRVRHTIRALLWPRGTMVAESPAYDLTFRFAVNDAIGRDIFCKWGVYSENYITRFVLDHIGVRDDQLILDIGANIGWYSLTLSSKARPMVFAFEPDPINFAMLQANISQNGKTNITAINAAVSDKPGTMTLYQYKKRNRGRHSLLPQTRTTGTVSVQTVSIDPFLAQRQLAQTPVHLLKIDIEGYELIAVRGAAETLQRTSFLLSEFSPAIMRENRLIPEDYLDLLQRHDFELYEMDPRGFTPLTPEHLCRSTEVHDIFGINRRLQPRFELPSHLVRRA